MPVADRDITTESLGMPWTYILECADGSFYVGSTYDLERRVAEHDLGLGAAYTRRRGRRPVRLAWAGEFTRIEEAFLFEKQVQRWGRAKRIALIEGRLGDLSDLGSRGYAGTAVRERAQVEGRAGHWTSGASEVEEVARTPEVEEVARTPEVEEVARTPEVEEVAQQPSRDH